MENGIAVLTNVEARTSNEKENAGLIFEFEDSDDLGNASTGHNEYLSLSSADRLFKSLNKMKYLSEHSSNPQAQAMFEKLPQAFIEVEDAMKDEIIFETEDEFANYVKEYPTDRLTYVYANSDKDDKDKILMKWLVDETKYQQLLAHTFSQFMTEEYDLTLKMNDTFQRLVNIGSADVA
jgi:Mg/Co/Ni transporter MgtE